MRKFYCMFLILNSEFSRAFHFCIRQVDQPILTNLLIDLILKCQLLTFSPKLSLSIIHLTILLKADAIDLSYVFCFQTRKMTIIIRQYSTHFAIAHTLHATKIYISLKKFLERTTHFSICFEFYNVASIILPKGGCHSRCCEGRRYHRRYR